MSELTDNSRDASNLTGWHSQRFCIFPQELILQFQGGVHITQIKLLAHETKIPSKVELYSFMPGVDNPGSMDPGISTLVTPESSNILFRRLGHFSLDSNEQSGFQSRELKTVHLGVTCEFFKLVLHRNHDNSYNLFNQVGLVKLQFMGHFLGDYELQAIKGSPNLQAQYSHRPSNPYSQNDYGGGQQN